jgi:DNA-binding NarL/FixJ family response regulator
MTEAAVDGGADVKVVIVTLVRLYHDGLAAALGCRPGIDVAGTAREGDDAVALIAAVQPSAALIDATLLLHSDLADRVRAACASTRIIAVGLNDDAPQIVACAEFGVASYVLRDASVDELVDALWASQRGETKCTPAVAASLMRRLAELAAPSRRLDGAADPLTLREREVIALVEQGLMNKEIARRLGLSLSTVKNHVHNVLDKLGLTSRADVVRWRQLTANSGGTGGRVPEAVRPADRG